MVKRCLRKDKREWADNIAKEAVNGANLGKGIYDATRKLSNDRPRNITMVKDKESKLLTKDDDIRKRWRNHFRRGIEQASTNHRGDRDRLHHKRRDQKGCQGDEEWESSRNRLHHC